MKVNNTLEVYEVDGEESFKVGDGDFQVSSHWLRDNLVVIQVNGGRKFTVKASDLKAAIDNATNWKHML